MLYRTFAIFVGKSGQQDDFEELEHKYEKLQILNKRILDKARNLQDENKTLLHENATLKQVIGNTKSRSSDVTCLLCSSLQTTLVSVDKAYKQTVTEKERVIKLLESRLIEYTSRDAAYLNISQKSHNSSIGSAKNYKFTKRKKELSPDSTSKMSTNAEEGLFEDSTSPDGRSTNSRLQLARGKQKRSRYTEDQDNNKKPRQEQNPNDFGLDVRQAVHQQSLPCETFPDKNFKIVVDYLSSGNKKECITEYEAELGNNVCVFVPETCDPEFYTVLDEHVDNVSDTPPRKNVKKSRNRGRNASVDTSANIVLDTCDVSQLSNTENHDDTVAGTPDKCKNKRSLRFSQKIKTGGNKNKVENLVIDSHNSVVNEIDSNIETQLTVKKATQRKRRVSLQGLLNSPNSNPEDVYDGEDVQTENFISHKTLNLSGNSSIEDDDNDVQVCEKKNMTSITMDETVRDDEITMLSPNYVKTGFIKQKDTSHVFVPPFESALPVMTSTQNCDVTKYNSPQASVLLNKKDRVRNITPHDKSPSIFAGGHIRKQIASTCIDDGSSEFPDPESPLLIRRISDSQSNMKKNKLSPTEKNQKYSANTDTAECLQKLRGKVMSDISNNNSSEDGKAGNEHKNLTPYHKKSSPTNKNLRNSKVAKTSKKTYGKLEFDDDITISRVLKQTTLSQVFSNSPLKMDKGILAHQLASSKEEQDVQQAIKLSLDEAHAKEFDITHGGNCTISGKENSPPFKKPSVPRKRRISTSNSKRSSPCLPTSNHIDPDETVAPQMEGEFNRDRNINDKPLDDHSDIGDIRKSSDVSYLNGSIDPDIQLTLYCTESEDQADYDSEKSMKNSHKKTSVSSEASVKDVDMDLVKSNVFKLHNSKKTEGRVEQEQGADDQSGTGNSECDLENYNLTPTNSPSENMTMSCTARMCGKNLKGAECATSTDNGDDVIDLIELQEESQRIPSSYKFGPRKRRSIGILDNFSEGINEDLGGATSEKDMDDSFDRIPKKKAVDFAYIDVVKKQNERRKLTGHVCQECYDYYKSTGMSEDEIQKRIQDCSRHRARYVPPDTPEHFWSIGFPDTQECEERGYINAAENAGPSRHRRKKHLKKRFKSRVEEEMANSQGNKETGI